MKKLFLALLVCLLSLGVFGCKGNDGEDDDDNLYENDVIETEETLAHATIKNTFVSAKFDLDNGSLVSLKNVQKGTDYLKDSVGGNFSMVVDVSTGNPFATDYQGENAVLVTSRDQNVEYELVKDDNKATLNFTYNMSFSFKGETYSGIKVLQKVVLNRGTHELTFSYEVENKSAKEVTIVTFTPAQLTGLKDSENGALKLFWPNKEGKIYDNAIAKIANDSNTKENLMNVYPGLASMQLVQLYNDVESLYYMVEDSTREYKIAKYGNYTIEGGHDYNQVTSADKVSLSFTQFPFIGANETKSIHDVTVGVTHKGNWHVGADAYQGFLRNNKMLNEYNDFVENWSGFISLVGSHYGSKHFSSYLTSESSEISYSDWIKDAGDSSGVDSVLILGWNDGGFDSMYPDYEFATGDGFNGETGFKQMANTVHENGDLFMPHINSRIADELSNWSQAVADTNSGVTNLESAAVKRAGFSRDIEKAKYKDYMICETYGTATMYYVMSSASKEFQNQLKSVVERLRTCGADGIWFDQLFERDGYLDYDTDHKMSDKSTPATLYAEGYQKIFEYFENAASTINKERPFMIIAGGGGGDYFAKWVDVYGGNWSRKLGARDNSEDSSLEGIGTENSDRHIMSPELINYTVPAVYIGQAGAGTLTGQSDEYARAFAMGMPFLVEQFTTSTTVLIETYNFFPQIFYKGIYKDTVGVSVNNENVMATVLISRNGKELGVQLYNTNTSSESVEVTISLKDLNIQGTITSIIDAFSGNNYSNNDGKVSVTLSENEFTSLIIQIG